MCGICQQFNPLIDTGLLHMSERLRAEVEEGADADDGYIGGSTPSYTISVGDTFLGDLNPAEDYDVIGVNLVAGQRYTVTLGADPGQAAQDTIDDTLILVTDNVGQQIAINDDVDFGAGDYGSSTTFTAGYTGLYKLVATSHGAWFGDGSGETGRYALSIAEAPPLTVWDNDTIAEFLNYGGWEGSSYRWDVAPGGALTYNVSALTAAGQAVADEALDAWSMVTGIDFLKVTEGGQITFDDDQGGAFAIFESNGTYLTSAEVNVSTAWLDDHGTAVGEYGFQTYIHEIGHALGLAHSGFYDGSAVYGSSNLYLNDSWQVSVMSYFDQDDNTFVNASEAYVITPQMADILAVQALYGVAGNIRDGDTVYGDNSTAGDYYDQIASLENIAFTILDDGGVDTLDTSSHAGAQTIYLEAETYSSVFGETGNMGIARGTILENVEGGSGADLVFGNDANNVVNGNDGNDTVYGGAGDDTLQGGAGADRLVGDAGTDTLIGGAGNDILKGKQGNNTLQGNGGDDKLIGADDGDDVMNGHGDSDILIGLAGEDMLNGDSGADFLYGGRDDDELRGGTGDDLLRGNLNNDLLIGGTGSDSLFGGGQNDTLRGEEGRDFLLGENGNDWLDGGTGDDNLTGGNGIDTFVYRDGGHGYDRVLDFELGTDKIDLSDFGFTQMSEINAIAADVAAGVRLNFGSGHVLLLEDIMENQLGIDDFILT